MITTTTSHNADQDLWQTLALTVMGGTQERAASFFESERAKWGKVIKAADIHIE